MDTQNNAFTVDDDFTFPHTRRGQALSGVLESTTEKPKASADAVEVFARQQARIQAMTAVLAWNEDGEYNYNDLDEYIIGMADLDGDFEIGDEEEAAYNAIWAEVPDALFSLGASEDDTNAFVNSDGKEADDAAARVGKVVVPSFGFWGAPIEQHMRDYGRWIGVFHGSVDSVIRLALPDSRRNPKGEPAVLRLLHHTGVRL